MKLSRLLGLPAAICALLLATLANLPAQAQGVVDAMRGPTPIAAESTPPILYPTENKDVRRERNYTGQPPTIPHKIDGTYMYQINKDHNGCLSCHARTKAEEIRAIAISPTHYVDRDGHQLADVSPRRFFCTQCHVPQADAKPLITNTFVDVDELLKRKPDGKSVGKN